MVKALILVAVLLAGCAQPAHDPDWLNKAFADHSHKACLLNFPAEDCH